MSENGIAQNTARFGSFRSCAATHAGTANRLNEDAYVNRPDLGLWAVADGAGGHVAGEIASAEVAGLLQSIDANLSASSVINWPCQSKLALRRMRSFRPFWEI